MSLSLYRECRPQKFSNVIGQPHVVRTLRNALKTGRIGHAYLFSGPRGTGKTSVARILAKALNCEKGPSDEPCDQCDKCRAIANDRFLDVLEIDAASSRGINEMKDLCERARLAPSEGRSKVIIVDEVHMLTPEAFNAFLKTLEEPPSGVVFILATTELHKVPPTVASRCQRFEFRRVSHQDMKDRLEAICGEKGLTIDEEAIEFIVESSEGSVRDAIGILDKAISFAGDARAISSSDVMELLGRTPVSVVEDLIVKMTRCDVPAILALVEEQDEAGRDLRLTARDVLRRLRSMLAGKPGGDRAKLLKAMEYLLIADSEMRHSSQSRLALEIALVKSALSLSEDGETQEEAEAPRAVDLLSLWPSFMARMRRADPRIHALLLECSPAGCQGDKVLLDFRREFHKQNVEREPNLSKVEKELSGIVGRPLKVVCRLVQARERQVAPSGAQKTTPAPDSSSVVEKILDVFDGSLVK